MNSSNRCKWSQTLWHMWCRRFTTKSRATSPPTQDTRWHASHSQTRNTRSAITLRFTKYHVTQIFKIWCRKNLSRNRHKFLELMKQARASLRTMFAQHLPNTTAIYARLVVWVFLFFSFSHWIYAFMLYDVFWRRFHVSTTRRERTRQGSSLNRSTLNLKGNNPICEHKFYRSENLYVFMIFCSVRSIKSP